MYTNKLRRRRNSGSKRRKNQCRRTVSNLLEQAINCDEGDHAARIIQDALGIESDDVVNYCFPKTWPDNREQRARIIGTWLTTEARYLAS